MELMLPNVKIASEGSFLTRYFGFNWIYWFLIE